MQNAANSRTPITRRIASKGKIEEERSDERLSSVLVSGNLLLFGENCGTGRGR